MATIERDDSGCSSLATFVKDRVGGGLTGAMISEARRFCPVDTGALRETGHVVRIASDHWKLSFGEGLPDARAVYQEVGTGGWFFQPPVDTDFSPLRGRRPGHVRARAYIRNAVFKERTL